MSDLRKLIEAVEAGSIANPTHANEFDAVGRENGSARDAYCGSIDVAKKLHEALLPGCSAVIQTNGTVQTIGPNYERHTGVAVDNPARAWLIAILKACEATNAEAN